MKRYTVTVGTSVRLCFVADLADASAPISILDNGENTPTPFQTADARHSAYKAAYMLNDWARNEGGEYGEYWNEEEQNSISITWKAGAQ